MARRDETATGITQRDRPRTDVLVSRDGAMVDPSGNPAGLTAAQMAATQALVSGDGTAFPGALPRARAALAKVRAGASNMKILRTGDSTEAGRGAPTSGSFVGSYATAPHKVFTDRFGSITGLPTRQNSFCGQASHGGILNYDSRLVPGSGWGGTGAYGIGGFAWYNNSTTNAMVFTPSNNCDTFDVYYIDAGTGVFSVQVDALAAVNTTCVNSNTIKKVSQSQTLGAHVLNIARVSGNVYIVGVHCYDSTTKEVSVFNGGWSGGKMTDWARDTPAYSPMSHLRLLAPDLTIIRPGTNDWLNATSVSSFQTDLSYFVSQAQLSGDVVIAPNLPANTASVSEAVQQTYVDAMLAVAVQYGCAYISHWKRSGGFALGNTLGMYDSDQIHFAKAANSVIGAADAELVARMLGS